ncbi:hypothetical protein B1750_gp249 [Noumeavirus]|uniref:hypothetical protein n=1 Tax=Noumeavirus TaxID=1955558 RepID=UPI000982DA5C|nr:hypothetical protein B1750_gp249 [Noumeavirus]AQM73230.1 hypothetical protein NMV_249 [Noumeavirus]AQQ73657.1 hypothetical protein [Kurlavirus BKC-1]
MTSYAKQIESITKEVKRMNEQSKKLRERKKSLEAKLFEYMEKRNLDEVSGIKRKNIAPKPKPCRLKKKEKDQLAVRMLTEVGLPDPEGFLLQMRKAESGKS